MRVPFSSVCVCASQRLNLWFLTVTPLPFSVVSLSSFLSPVSSLPTLALWVYQSLLFFPLFFLYPMCLVYLTAPLSPFSIAVSLRPPPLFSLFSTVVPFSAYCLPLRLSLLCLSSLLSRLSSVFSLVPYLSSGQRRPRSEKERREKREERREKREERRERERAREKDATILFLYPLCLVFLTAPPTLSSFLGPLLPLPLLSLLPIVVAFSA